MSNLTTHGRQYGLVLEQPFDFTDFNGVTTVAAIKPKLPVNAIVLRGGVLVTEAFGTGAAADVGKNGAANQYLNDVDLNTLGYTAFTGGVGLKASGETIEITPDTEAKAATAGKGYLIVEYVIAGRANEVQP